MGKANGWSICTQGSEARARGTSIQILEAFKRLDAYNEKTIKRNGGITQLGSDDRQAASDFFDQLQAYGIFVVRGGELEQWLPKLGIARTKDTWLKGIFEAMGEDPTDSNYVKPSRGDVWDFMGDINTWLSNPSRRGMPHVEPISSEISSENSTTR